MSDAGPFSRAFTVDEADALLPELEAVFRVLDGHRASLEGHLGKIQILDVLWGAQLADPGNPDRHEFLEERAAVREAIHGIERVVERRLNPLGVRFPPGGLEQGLVDFPTTLDGRWVFLCWQRGEPAVACWHELDGGFAGRRPLTDAQAARMGSGRGEG
jgi:hypothetical protein